MEILETALFYSHLLGFAAVAGGLMVNLGAKSYRATSLSLNGARWQLLSGLLLAGMWHEEYATQAVILKLLVALIILLLLEVYHRKPNMPKKVFLTTLSLVIAQTFIALFVAID